MAKTVLKRIVASIGIIFAFSTMSGGIREFDEATTGIEVFRGLFWLVVGGIALYMFIQDFSKKEWPLGGN